MKYSKIEFNSKGKQISFQCTVCGKFYSLDEMHYDSYDHYRICNECFENYRNKRLELKQEENKVVVEELLKSRKENLVEEDC